MEMGRESGAALWPALLRGPRILLRSTIEHGCICSGIETFTQIRNERILFIPSLSEIGVYAALLHRFHYSSA